MDKTPIVFYDGECGLCNTSVSFLIKHDKEAKIIYASLQSDFAKKTLEDSAKIKIDLDSVILRLNDQLYYYSDAALLTLKIIGYPWKIFSLFLIFPVKLRNIVYNFIARNRKRFFSKKVCSHVRLSHPERFID